MKDNRKMILALFFGCLLFFPLVSYGAINRYTLDKMQALLTLLQVELQKERLQTVPKPQPSLVVTCQAGKINRTLTLGSRGLAVGQLQQYLIDAGFLGLAIPTNYFDSRTVKAVKMWQRTEYLPETGIFGLSARLRLAKLCS